jgi:hypothetical protein
MANIRHRERNSLGPSSNRRCSEERYAHENKNMESKQCSTFPLRGEEKQIRTQLYSNDGRPIVMPFPSSED